jgi:hypothetical protein
MPNNSIISIKNKENLSHYIISSHTFRIFLSILIRTSLTNQIANLAQDSKVNIASDQVFLPKIS